MERPDPSLDPEPLWLHQGATRLRVGEVAEPHTIITSERTSGIHERFVLSILVTVSNVYLILSILGGLFCGVLAVVGGGAIMNLVLILSAVAAVIQGVCVWALLQAIGSITHSLMKIRDR
jgi:hypothetical protein